MASILPSDEHYTPDTLAHYQSKYQYRLDVMQKRIALLDMLARNEKKICPDDDTISKKFQALIDNTVQFKKKYHANIEKLESKEIKSTVFSIKSAHKFLNKAEEELKKTMADLRSELEARTRELSEKNKLNEEMSVFYELDWDDEIDQADRLLSILYDIEETIPRLEINIALTASDSDLKETDRNIKRTHPISNAILIAERAQEKLYRLITDKPRDHDHDKKIDELSKKINRRQKEKNDTYKHMKYIHPTDIIKGTTDLTLEKQENGLNPIDAIDWVGDFYAPDADCYAQGQDYIKHIREKKSLTLVENQSSVNEKIILLQASLETLKKINPDISFSENDGVGQLLSHLDSALKKCPECLTKNLVSTAYLKIKDQHEKRNDILKKIQALQKIPHMDNASLDGFESELEKIEKNYRLLESIELEYGKRESALFDSIKSSLKLADIEATHFYKKSLVIDIRESLKKAISKTNTIGKDLRDQKILNAEALLKKSFEFFLNGDVNYISAMPTQAIIDELIKNYETFRIKYEKLGTDNTATTILNSMINNCILQHAIQTKIDGSLMDKLLFKTTTYDDAGNKTEGSTLKSANPIENLRLLLSIVESHEEATATLTEDDKPSTVNMAGPQSTDINTLLDDELKAIEQIKASHAKIAKIDDEVNVILEKISEWREFYSTLDEMEKNADKSASENDKKVIFESTSHIKKLTKLYIRQCLLHPDKKNEEHLSQFKSNIHEALNPISKTEWTPAKLWVARLTNCLIALSIPILIIPAAILYYQNGTLFVGPSAIDKKTAQLKKSLSNLPTKLTDQPDEPSNTPKPGAGS